MIKTIFTIAIVVAILNAIGHAGMAAWRHFQVKDQAQQLILFGGNTPTADLEWQIAQIAEEFEVPVAPEDIVVSAAGRADRRRGVLHRCRSNCFRDSSIRSICRSRWKPSRVTDRRCRRRSSPSVLFRRQPSS